MFDTRVLVRFKSRVSIVFDPYSCWEWKGATRPYGKFRLRGKSMGAHRVAHILFIGEIPKGHVVCHACDNPKCVRPSHLFSATQKDNVRDMYEKGRAGNQKEE